MKVLIAYSSKNGTTYKCVQILKNSLPDYIDTDVVDIEKSTPALDDYDAVAVGGSIRMGNFSKKLRAFLKENKERLSTLPTAVFICCGFSQNFEEYAETQVPRKLNCALGIHNFGGELKPEKLTGLDKFLVRIMRNSITNLDFEDSDTKNISLPEIIPENIALLAEEIKKLSIK